MRYIDDVINKTFTTDTNKLPKLNDLQRVLYLGDILDFSGIDRVSEFWSYRTEYIRYSYTILSDNLLNGLKEFIGNRTVSEVCCGAGWLSHWMKTYGINLQRSVDTNSWRTDGKSEYWKRKIPNIITHDAAEFVKHYNSDVIVMSWPPYKHNIASKVWNNMTEGQFLIYIGEGLGGCTGDDEFHEMINDYEIENAIPYISFYGIHDRVFTYQK